MSVYLSRKHLISRKFFFLAFTTCALGVSGCVNDGSSDGTTFIVGETPKWSSSTKTKDVLPPPDSTVTSLERLKFQEGPQKKLKDGEKRASFISRFAAGTKAINRQGSMPEAPASGEVSALREAVASALKLSPETNRQRVALSGSELGVGIARSGYYPSIGGDTSIDDKGNPSVILSGEQTIYDWGQVGATVRQAKSKFNHSLALYNATRERVALDAVTEYLNVLKAQKLEDLARENVEEHRKILELATDRVSGGASDSTELQLADIRYGQSEAELADQLGGVRAAQGQFKILVGRSAGRLTMPSLEAENLPEPGHAADVFRAKALENAPDVRLALAQQKSLSAQADAERASLWPRLSLQGEVGLEDGFSDDDYRVSLRFKSPLYNGLSNFRKVEVAELEAEAARWNVDHARRSVNQVVSEFEDRAPTLLRQKEILQKQLGPAIELRDHYKEQFKIGARSMNDLVSAQQDLNRIRVSIVNSEIDYIYMRYKVAESSGELLSLMGFEDKISDKSKLKNL